MAGSQLTVAVWVSFNDVQWANKQNMLAFWKMNEAEYWKTLGWGVLTLSRARDGTSEVSRGNCNICGF